MRSRSQTQTRLVSKLSEKVTSKCCKFSFILFCVWLLFCSAGLSVLSDFANVSLRKRERERAGCFTLIVFLLSCGR